MDVEIKKIEPHSRGTIYTCLVSGDQLEVLFLSHAMERIKKWGINDTIVAETLVLPEEVLVGHGNRYIAQKRYGLHIVRAVYEYEKELPVLITVYFPYSERYFKGGGIYENKIFRRR